MPIQVATNNGDKPDNGCETLTTSHGAYSVRIRRARSVVRHGLRTYELWQFLTALLALFGLMQTCPAGTSQSTPEVRAATAYRTFSDIHQLAAAWYVQAPSWTRAGRMEVVTGAIAASGKSRPFVSVGPVWRLTTPDQPFFAEFAFAPTALGGSSLGDRDLGGNLHFTSSLVVGAPMGARQRQRIALRIQHLSNGGLHKKNPGLDSIGLSFTADFDDY